MSALRGARTRKSWTAPAGLSAITLVLSLAALPVGGVQRLVAQTTDQVVNQRRLEYQAAQAEYDSALRAQRVLAQQFDDALEQVRGARRSGNADALERASAHAQDVGVPYGAQEERVRRTLDSLSAARQSLIDIITVRLEELLGQMDAASSAEQRAQLNDIWRDLDNELKSLESENAEGFRIEPIVMPEIKVDPRDGPAELLQKAGLLERRAATADTTIQEVDRRIKSLDDRLRLRRQVGDLLNNIDRFGDTQVPVVSGQPTSGRPAAADSTSAGPVPLTLEERIRRLYEYRQHLVNYRDQVLLRARQFRESVRSVAQ